MRIACPRALVWIGSAIAFAVLACGCACPRAKGPEPAVETSQIEKRLQEVLDAAEKKDFERLDSYHLYGPKFTKFTSSSPDRLDAAAGRNGEHKGLGGISDLKMRADTLKVDVFGDVGIATFILDYSFASGGQIVRRKERSTLVFVKDSREWRIVHEHLSPIQ